MKTPSPLAPRPSPLTLLPLILLTIFMMAHSQPTRIVPAPGSTVGRTPKEIRLVFAEPLSDNISIEVLPKDSFSAIPGVSTQKDPQNPSEIFASLPTLEPGNYTVQWQVESSDGHFVSGFYSFAVANSIWAVIPPWAIVLAIGIPILIAIPLTQRKNARRPTR